MKLAIVALLASCIFATAADLNSPGQKQVTISTEISRGSHAVLGQPPKGDTLESTQQILDVFKANKQQNTDSEGFLLGANCAAWIECLIIADIAKKSGSAAPGDIALAEKFAAEYCQEFRGLQKKLGVRSDQLCELTGLSIKDKLHALDIADSQKQAAKLYPELTKKGSPLNAEFLSRYNRYQKENAAFFTAADWPLRLAKECAESAK